MKKVQVEQYNNFNNEIFLLNVISFLHTKLVYEQRLANSIVVENNNVLQKLITDVSELYKTQEQTIKIEGMERFNEDTWKLCNYFANKFGHKGPVTCHVFIANKNSPSFPMHTDPDDVIIYCCNGNKTLQIEDKIVTLQPNDYVYIPYNIPHKAINENASTILSIGLERFLIEKI